MRTISAPPTIGVITEASESPGNKPRTTTKTGSSYHTSRSKESEFGDRQTRFWLCHDLGQIMIVDHIFLCRKYCVHEAVNGVDVSVGITFSQNFATEKYSFLFNASAI